MKKLCLLSIVTFFLFQSCTVMNDVTTTIRNASYFVSLDKVEMPSNSKERFSETIQKDSSDVGVTKYVFEDDNIIIYWIVLDDEFVFTINNKSNHAIKIPWDEVVYINTEKSISKMIHSGVKYIKMNEGQVATTIPKGTKLEDILIPVENIHLVSNEWVSSSLFPNDFSSDEKMEMAKKMEGKEVSILMPIIIQDVQNDYTFTFKIEKVEVGSEKKTAQVYNPEESFKRTMAAVFIPLGAVLLSVIIAATTMATATTY